jgi:Class III cytochrome C family
MLKHKWLLGIILSGVVATMGLAMENKGTANIQIEGGTRGSVPFPHRIHQDMLGDCKICHAVFPQEAQSLTRLKNEGQLKPKEVMNKQCVKCHRTEKKAGNKTGPTTCSKCHVR